MQDHQDSLLTLYQDEYASIVELDRLLSEEYAALKQNEIERITEYTEKKQRLLDIIARLDEQRRTQQEQLSAGSIQKQLNKHKLTSIKEKMDALLKKCRQQNQTNGGMIAVNQNFYSKILDIICNGDTASKEVYGTSGKSLDTHISQSLAKI